MGQGVFIGCNAAPTQEAKTYLDFDLKIDTEVEVNGMVYQIIGNGWFTQPYQDSNIYLEIFEGSIYEPDEGKEVFAGKLTEGEFFKALLQDCENWEKVFETANSF